MTVTRYHAPSIENDIRREYGWETKIPSEALGLVNTPRHFGKHPAAIAISSISLNQIAPKNDQGTLMLDMKTAELDAGIIKIDALGLSQVNVFRDFLEATGETLDRFYEIEAKFVEAFNQQKCCGIFQFGYAVKAIAKQVRFDHFDDISDVIALARPGPRDAGYVDKWVSAKLSGGKVNCGIADIDSILQETKGVFIYQEQIMRICRVIAGFSWPEVNAVRRGIGKKKVEIIAEYRERFINGWHQKSRQKRGILEPIVDGY